MSAACGEMARQWGDDDGFFLIIMPAFFPPFYNSFFFFCGCLQNILQKKKIIAASLKKGKMCGTSSSLHSSEAQDLSAGCLPSMSSSCSRQESSTLDPESAFADCSHQTLPHLAGDLINTAHTPGRN